jgi:hypothetical protein
LFAGLFLQAPLAAGQGPPRPPQPQLTADARIRLSEAARDSTLTTWQREFMLEVAHSKVEGDAAEPSATLPGLVPPPVGIAVNDGAWTTVPPPPGRYAHTAFYDPVRDRLVVFGGWDGSRCNDAWALSLAGSPAWSALTPAGNSPPARVDHTAIYDPLRDRIVVFGGSSEGASYRNDVWALSLAGSPVWSELTPAGTPPPGRHSHSAFYDPVRDRMVAFGGTGGSLRNDVWALSLAGSPAWSELTPAGTLPTGRVDHTSIYDPLRDRMVVFGGNDGNVRNDVWALSLAGSPAWSELTPTGTPPIGRTKHTAIYDPPRDRMVVLGGFEGR